MPDAELRDFENVPLKDDIDVYFGREVLPHVPDAWMDRSKDKMGYEISFTKYFYEIHAAPLHLRNRYRVAYARRGNRNLLREVVRA